MKIIIPNNNLNERRYIIDIILNEFLGLEFKILISNNNVSNWIIELSNEKKLIIEDHFFNPYKKKLEYLNIKNIPSNIQFSTNDFIVENDIPIIFGNSTLKIENSTLTCSIDIFASSFFMLTRWEEYVDKTRDEHERFASISSLAFKYNFLDRPVVNEYIEMLWNMLTHLGIEQQRKKREYKLIPTHDVDFPLRYFSTKKVIKEIARDLVKNKKYKEAILKAKEYSSIKLGFNSDPYDTFDYMINTERKAGLKSYFFFMGEGTSPMYDDNYDMNDKYIQKLVKKITNAEHKIGIHPSYFTYNNKNQMQKEKENIEKSTNIKIKYGRQHYLRFEVPTTWQNWEDNNMVWDSTISYADKEGFRCGVCYEYSVFNILTRKKLKLKEKPLIMMEGSFVTYQPNITPKEMMIKINNLINTVKKYQGEFVFLWHNSCYSDNWRPYKNIYEQIVRSNEN
jgi:hypothetical protein